MAYIQSSSERSNGSMSEKTGCIFCDNPSSPQPEKELIVFKAEHAFVMMNLYPYNTGHLLIAPYLHSSEYENLPIEATKEMNELLQKSIRTLKIVYNPHGFNVGMNLGEAAGAGIAQHLHMHIVPRWTGDSNFMPVIGDIKVMPDTVEGSYKKIVEAWSH
jgi:ATP adenylyltransferase